MTLGWRARRRVLSRPTVRAWPGLAELEACLVVLSPGSVHPGIFGSVRDVNAKIQAFVDGWSARYHPFIWTKTSEQILTKANRRTPVPCGRAER